MNTVIISAAEPESDETVQGWGGYFRQRACGEDQGGYYGVIGRKVWKCCWSIHRVFI